jgi:SNF2 family DNA or RNA helicase
VRALQKELEDAGLTVGMLNGDVSPNARNMIINEFKTEADPQVLLCHPKVMSHGLNLTEADTLIFYAPIFSNDEYQQVMERFNRAGQKRKMTIIRMAAHPLEWEIFKLLDNRQSTQNSILNLYKVVTE